MLATVADLEALLERDDINEAKATRLIEIATAVVQATTGQRLVRVTNEQITLIGGTSGWLTLPQRPVVSVSAVTLDGVAVAGGHATGQYRLIGDRLWRTDGWTRSVHAPSEVGVTYTHGFAYGDQGRQLADGAVLSIIVGAYSNPEGLKAETIDDYSVTYGALSGQLDTTRAMRAALRRQYGRGAGVVTVAG